MRRRAEATGGSRSGAVQEASKDTECSQGILALQQVHGWKRGRMQRASGGIDRTGMVHANCGNGVASNLAKRNHAQARAHRSLVEQQAWK